MSSLFEKVFGTSITAADKAGDIVRGILKGGNLEIVQKTGESDLQTAADRIVNDIIVGSLKREFPGLCVIGEEGDAAPLQEPDLYLSASGAGGNHDLKQPLPARLTEAKVEELTVWVDPLDATKEYTEGHLDHVTVLVGIALGKEAVAGVIHQPFYGYKDKPDGASMGRTLYGVVGAGIGGCASLEEEAKKSAPDNEKIVTTSRSHSNSLVNAALDAIKPTQVIRAGGSGYKVLLLIEGRAHAYVFPSPGCKKWDTCGPEAILTALGGKLTDLRGNAYPYDSSAPFPDEWGVLATRDHALHAQIMAEIPDEVKGQVKDFYKKK